MVEHVVVQGAPRKCTMEELHSHPSDMLAVAPYAG